MCGIFGITWKDPKLTAAIASCVTHRGPDQCDDGSVVVVFNGEIYNFGEIRRELELCRLRKHADSVWQQPL